MAEHRAHHRAAPSTSVRAWDLIARVDGDTAPPARGRHAAARPSITLPTVIAAVSASALGVTAVITAGSAGLADGVADAGLTINPALAASAFTLGDSGTKDAGKKDADKNDSDRNDAGTKKDANPAPVTGADLAATVLPPTAAPATATAEQDTASDPKSGSTKAADDDAKAANAKAAASKAADAKAAASRAADAKAADAKAAASKAASKADDDADDSAEAPVVTGASSAAGKALAFAKASIGKPYRYGAAGPNAFDCSGLVMSAFKKAGVTLPRTSSAQSTVGTAVSRDDLRPGDLVFFYSPVSHVGIYIGDGKMVHASTTGQPVQISSIGNREFHNARRV